jgi:hypothetical protein
MNTRKVHNFGIVDETGDAFEFSVGCESDDTCYLFAVVQTERGPNRTEVASLSVDQWNVAAAVAVKELVSDMDEDERGKKAPTFQHGVNRLSPLLGRELGVLLITLMEETAADRADAVLLAWRELAREERWWLYSKATGPGQRPGTGWRRALFHALGETFETRTAPAEEAQKKSSGNTKKRRSRKTKVQRGAANPKHEIVTVS